MRSEGRVPERNLEAKLMEVTRDDVSQSTPDHLQKESEGLHDDGTGEREVRSSSMVEASSSGFDRERKKEENK